MRGQGSLEYLLLIGGGVLVAVVVISVIISIPQTTSGSNEYGVATAQCLAYPNQTLCTGKVTVSGKDYYCVWNPSEAKCLAQQVYCGFSPTGDLGYKTIPYNRTITVNYAGFAAGTPNSPTTINCGDGGSPNATLTCNGSPSGSCTADCTYDSSPIDLASILLTNGTQSTTCQGVTLTMQYCGDGIPNGVEVCDKAQPPQNCTTAQGYPGTQTCKNDCTGWNDCTTTLSCGDKIFTKPPEVCECGADQICGTADDYLDGQTCITQGCTGGTLYCANGCLAFDKIACTDCGGGGQTCAFNLPIGGTHVYLGQPVPVDIGHTGFLPQPDRSHYIETPEQTYGPPTPKVRCETNGGTNTADLICDGTHCTSTCNYTAGGSKAFPAIDLKNATQTATCNGPTITIDYCGDGIKNESEQCDGSDLGGQDCQSQDPRFVSGTLQCKPDCSGFDTSQCIVGLNSCGTPPGGWEAGRKYVLTQDVTFASGSCFAITQNDVNLNCNNKFIRTTGTGTGVAISAPNIIVRDCSITYSGVGRLGTGILLNSTANQAKIVKNIITVNDTTVLNLPGIRVTVGDNHEIIGNQVSSVGNPSNGRAIWISAGSSNKISNNFLCGYSPSDPTDRGIYITSGAQKPGSSGNECWQGTCYQQPPGNICVGTNCDVLTQCMPPP